MANYQNLKAAISAAIRTNGNQEITGQVLQDVLNSIVSVIGANYTFAGVATPATNPGTPDQNVMYLAMEGGTYTNFNGTVLPAGISLLMWNGTWTSETVMYGDGGVFDISVYKSSGGTLATFADLAAALDGGNNIPASARKGGMSVKFIQGTAQSSDNKYVQYFLTKDEWSTDVSDWEKLNLEEEVSQLGQEVIFQKQNITETTVSTYAEYPGVVLNQNVKYLLYIKTSSLITAQSSAIGLWYNVNDSASIIRQATPEEMYVGFWYEYTPSSTGKLGVRTKEVGISYQLIVGVSVVQELKDEELFTNEQLRNSTNFNDTTTTTVVEWLNKEVIANTKYNVYVKTSSLITTQSGDIGLWYMDNQNNTTKIRAATPEEMYHGFWFEYTPLVDGQFGIRTKEIGISYITIIELSSIDNIHNEINALSNKLSPWIGKNVVVYGDSITAQGNGDIPSNNSFMYWSYLSHRFANLYVRGVGGQTYVWNTYGWYCKESGGNGNYVDRYKYDAQGQRLNEIVNPLTVTQQEIDNIEAHYGFPIDVHYGAFCSWDRIKSMIPSDIREAIDLVIICGGHNDFEAVEEVEVEGDISAAEPEWRANDVTDPTWSADTTYYKGGDYDITTFSGAIASTIMKMQTWCPNAVVVVATPFPRFNISTKQQYTNQSGLSFRRMCEIIDEIAHFVSAPVIDANGDCGINGVNFSNYQTDGVHPNLDGRKMFGRVFVGDLIKFANKIQ
jgi:lysophospholipase L1-like esterase